MNTTTQQKRAELSIFIERVILPQASIRGVVVIGSVARGTARADSDIDAAVFLDPLDLYAVPAECKWRPEDGSFHGIFQDVKDALQLDFHRLDLRVWSDPAYEWPESMRAELSEGWLAFDRDSGIGKLVAERTVYRDESRLERLDDALVSLDWLLNEDTTEDTWERLGVNIAHDRLHAAYEKLVQGLFAYNRRWRTIPSRELTGLFQLPWLPGNFEAQWLQAANALSVTRAGYRQRAAVLRQFFFELIEQCRKDGLYGSSPVSEAFIRRHDEPGRNWNMAEWNRRHQEKEP